MWTYMPVGPFHDRLSFDDWCTMAQTSADPMFHTIRGEDGRVGGVASFLRIDPPGGVAEVGYISFTPRLQRTRAATEAMALMMGHVFAHGYRRYEWKCNALNAGSMRAAERLGFQFEGTFRQAMVVKGRNRDTAWFSLLDTEWPAQSARFEAWLAPENFDENGQQTRPLSTR
jgi:RimJ/RimL family protein N-acetyltransferase